MKIQLDTTNKTIKLDENIKISKLIETLKQLLPNDWKNFTLETHTTIINWSEPYYYKHITPWYENPWVYCKTDINTFTEKTGFNMNTSDTGEYLLKEGIYNVEM